ncbi:hypothetical protein D9758_003727 [Tetrapyrgos nigripes]|uniref:Uncharacterized protein n=1 Tax=Tetrapyrgos nigripes TaxID=182062 RepID=A0A8H5GMQ4_9AGAR|nr:hypothetical protein D9758_003727 [Tetrapyrgos nigripes]
MSSSPVSLRRLSNSSNYLKEQEILINEYEAEEERIINVLSRKLEQLREEKIDLENTLEAESESHVNRLSRQLSAMRMAQQAQTNGTNSGSGDGPISMNNVLVADPSTEVMLEALRQENEQLRNRLADIERDYIRISRLNEIYREELIEHRSRLGESVDNLVGLSSDSFSRRPIRQRSTSSLSSTSPSTSVGYYPSPSHPPANGVPIPRTPSQIHRPVNNISEANTPLSHSGSSMSESPFPLGDDPASFASNLTSLTTPSSSASFHAHYNATLANHGPQRQLTYPSVPPPSLSSSFGSPNVSYHIGNASYRDQSLSPVEPLSRRNSNARIGVEWRVAETGNLRSISASRSQSRRGSMDRGGRVAETGSLTRRRSRAESHGQGMPLPSTTEAPEAREPDWVNDGPGT